MSATPPNNKAQPPGYTAIVVAIIVSVIGVLVSVSAIIVSPRPVTKFHLILCCVLMSLLCILGASVSKIHKPLALTVLVVLFVIAAYTYSVYDELTTKTPIKDAYSLYKKGLGYIENNDLINALRAFNEAIDLKPDFFEARKEIGRCHTELGNYKDATESFKLIVSEGPNEINPLIAKAYLLWGVEWCRQGNEIEAQKCFHPIVKYDQELYRQAMASLGKCY